MKNVKKQIQKIPLLVFLMLFCSMTAIAQQFTARGIIVDNDGNPVIGAQVVLKGETTGAISDYNGNFTLRVPNENASLVIYYVGMKTKEVMVAKNSMRIVMENENKEKPYCK